MDSHVLGATVSRKTSGVNRNDPFAPLLLKLVGNQGHLWKHLFSFVCSIQWLSGPVVRKTREGPHPQGAFRLTQCLLILALFLLGTSSFVVGSCPLYCRGFAASLPRQLLDTSNTSSTCDNQNWLPTLWLSQHHRCPRAGTGKNHPQRLTCPAEKIQWTFVPILGW